MSDLFALYARTFLIGIAVAAPVGAMGVLCTQRTLSRGWRTGIATGLGIATADGIYAAIAAFGMSALSSLLVTWQMPLRVVGGLALVALGVRAAIAAPTACKVDEVDGSDRGDGFGPVRVGRLYLGAVGLTLTNPMTIMAFGAIFASAGLVAQPGVAEATVATIGVASGSLAWWVTLVSGVALARHAVGERLLRSINIASGAGVALFGFIAVMSVFIV